MQKWIFLVLICISYQTGEFRHVFKYLLTIVFLLCGHLFFLLYYEFFIWSLILFQYCTQFVLWVLIALLFLTYFLVKQIDHIFLFFPL